MPKGKANPFQPYKRKGGDVQAQVIEVEEGKEITLGGETFGNGDYIVMDQGEITGAKKEDFEKVFEPLKKAWPKKKKKVAEGATEGATGSAEPATAAA